MSETAKVTASTVVKAYMAATPGADLAIVRKAVAKLGRAANNLQGSLHYYVLENGMDNTLAEVGSYYAETLAKPSGRGTSNAAHTGINGVTRKVR